MGLFSAIPTFLGFKKVAEDKNFLTSSPTNLLTSKKAAFTLAEVFFTHSAGQRKCAFTLAEVLITLGIIGVVAAMTLPTLQQKLDERSNISMLKKFYSEFANATNLLVYDYGEPEVWGLRDNDSASSQAVIDMYKKKLNMTKICGDGDSSCFNFPIANYNGVTRITEDNFRSWRLKSFVLNNGTTVFFDVNNGWFSVFFDVNGKKKPNRLGVDVFAWAVNGKGKIVSHDDASVAGSGGAGVSDYNYAFEIMENSWIKKY